MENSDQQNLLRFLSEQEKLTEQRLQKLNSILETNFSVPDHIVDTLHHLRQNAEDDLSNILHIQSIYPRSSLTSTNPSVRPQLLSPVRRAVVGEGRTVLGEVEEAIETGEVVLADDDMFAIDGVSVMSPHSAFSDEEREDSELDEGIHIPGKIRSNKPVEVAASLPVGIPWPAQLTAGGRRQQAAAAAGGQLVDRLDSDNPSDIAASIQALAKSVHTSSMFGDNVFGDLPRPRTNTYSKD